MQIFFQMQNLVGCSISMPIARIFRGSLCTMSRKQFIGSHTLELLSLWNHKILVEGQVMNLIFLIAKGKNCLEIYEHYFCAFMEIILVFPPLI